ncbi:uncharacterized protein RCO7_00726 [Rhynchosporium graminicola]|uniref:Phosphate transporter n=1 Tax=Rhynchosporium graminicola TaxID=2792576 RepID=A0A1E1K2Q0_9HELO|nr:uncharacterized protein RCO7_00726 [Rhynchosporium commune]
MPALEEVTWIIAVTSVAFCASSLGNGANDVSNSYATAIASGTLTFKQAGVLAILTEFAGAVVLGGRVTEKIKNGVINVHHFDQHPSALVLAMGCVEFGTSAWLTIATSMGLPVSTTQTMVACLAGVGIASGATLKWGWQGKGLSTIAAAWLISPLFAGVVAALIQSLLNVTVLNRNNPYESALRSMPFYIAATCTLFPVFILLELLGKQSIQGFGIARFVVPIVGTFIVILFLAYFFAIPNFRRSLEEDKKDCRLRLIHIPMGPLLLRENPPYYLPNKKECTAHFVSVEAKSSSSSSIESGRTSHTNSGNIPIASETELLASDIPVIPLTPKEKYGHS